MAWCLITFIYLATNVIINTTDEPFCYYLTCAFLSGEKGACPFMYFRLARVAFMGTICAYLFTASVSRYLYNLDSRLYREGLTLAWETFWGIRDAFGDVTTFKAIRTANCHARASRLEAPAALCRFCSTSLQPKHFTGHNWPPATKHGKHRGNVMLTSSLRDTGACKRCCCCFNTQLNAEASWSKLSHRCYGLTRDPVEPKRTRQSVVKPIQTYVSFFVVSAAWRV